jgi:hypothetical protein
MEAGFEPCSEAAGVEHMTTYIKAEFNISDKVGTHAA